MKSTSDGRLRVMIIAQFFWLFLVCLLGAWWGRLLLRQAKTIAMLEKSLGRAATQTQGDWHRTERMLFWESATFFALLLACSGWLLWLYWRDLKRSQGLQAFFGSVTHELRTPLTSIRLQAESIADSWGESPSTNWGDSLSGKNLVARLLEDCLRLEAQVERTLELARVEGGGPVYPQPVPLKAWVDRFLKLWKSDERGTVDVRVLVEDVLIQADPTALGVIFRNILENALKHSLSENLQVTVKSSSEASGVEVVIRDNGKGYLGDPKTLGKIFQKGASSQGTGVGLYLVSALMKQMGGGASFKTDSGFEVGLRFREVSHV